MKHRNRTQRTMGHSYDSPRGSMMSRVDTEYVETKFVDVSKEDPYLSFDLLDVYGFNLNYSKGF